MLKENINFSKLQLEDPLITRFSINIHDIIEECHSLPEILSMLRLFKTIAVHRQDFPTANKFREAERELRQQAAAFEYSWAWMNADQMKDEIKKQVAELIPTLSFKPALGGKENSNSSDDGPRYEATGSGRTRTTSEDPRPPRDGGSFLPTAGG